MMIYKVGRTWWLKKRTPKIYRDSGVEQRESIRLSLKTDSESQALNPSDLTARKPCQSGGAFVI